MFTYTKFKFIWIVENDAFSLTVKLVNVSFNKYRILIRNLYLLKGFTAKKLSKEFPSKHSN